MKKFNLIASIVVVVLALVSAVASYFLYEKRVQFVNGWKDMSEAMVTTAQVINAESKDKSAGSKVTKDALDHKKYDAANFTAMVKNLPAQARNFVQQYQNAMAEREAMSKAIAMNSENFAKLGVKLEAPPAKSDNKNDDAEEGEDSGEAEGNEAEDEAAGEDAKNAEPAPEFVGEIAFDNNPESVKELIERFNKQSAAFFAKHEQLVNDHKKLTDDYNALKSRYEKLQRDYATLKGVADNRGNQLKIITGQRDYMAETLAAIAKKSGVGTGYDNPQYYKDANKSSDRIDKVAKTTLALLDNREKMINEIVKIAVDNGEKIDRALIARRPDQGLAPLRQVISKQREARKVYAGALSTISGRLGVKFTDDLAKTYSNPQVVVNAVNNKINEARNLQNELKKAGERQRAADAQIRQQQQRIAKLEADAREFAKANKLEVTGGDIEIKNWPRGSVEARMATIGTVTKVSKEYGYIVIDFGTETTVIQSIGKKRIPVNPDLQSGLKFNVIRNDKFVAAVTLRIVDKKESTADIPPSKAGDIEVGDKVVFAK